MQLVNRENVLLKEKLPKKKDSDEPIIVGEATVVLSEIPELKKGDNVVINRNGILPIKRGKVDYILLHEEDILLKI